MRKISSRAGGLCTLPTDKPASRLHGNLFKQKIHMARRPNIPNRAQQPKKQVVQIDPNIVNIFQQGLTSHQRGQLSQAKTAYEQVLAKQPKHFDALHLLGVVAAQTKNQALAAELIGKAIDINPNSASAFYNRGTALKDLKRLDDALSSYDKAIALNPDYEFLQGTKLHTQMRICDWSNLQNQSNRLLSAIADELKVIPPFFLLGLMDRPDLQLKVSKIFANANYPERDVCSEFTARPADGKIRIGYYSADFRDHPVSHLMAELFELHDTERFEIYGFSFRNSSNSEMRQRVANAVRLQMV